MTDNSKLIAEAKALAGPFVAGGFGTELRSLLSRLTDALEEHQPTEEDVSLQAAYDDLKTEYAEFRKSVRPPAIREGLLVDGRVNYLVHGAKEGEWWVTTEEEGRPYSGMPLDYFLHGTHRRTS